MDVETRQAKGRLGRLWFVTIDPGNNGTIRVKVAGDSVDELLNHIWQNRLSGNKKMKPPAPTLFRSTLDLLEGITAIEPAPGQYVLHNKRWTRYVVRVYCCDELVEVVAVSKRQMKMLLWNNWSGALPYAPKSDGVSWDNFHPQIVSEEPAVEAKKSVRLLPSPKPKPLMFDGIHCPTCGCHNEAIRQRCRECSAPLREDARGTMQMREEQPGETEPVLVGL